MGELGDAEMACGNLRTPVSALGEEDQVLSRERQRPVPDLQQVSYQPLTSQEAGRL